MVAGLPNGNPKESVGTPLSRSVVAAAYVLEQLGCHKLGWQPVDQLSLLKLSEEERAHMHMSMYSKSLLETLEAMLLLLMNNTSTNPSEDQSSWENIGIALEVTTLFLGCDWAYEEVPPQYIFTNS